MQLQQYVAYSQKQSNNNFWYNSKSLGGFSWAFFIRIQCALEFRKESDIIHNNMSEQVQTGTEMFRQQTLTGRLPDSQETGTRALARSVALHDKTEAAMVSSTSRRLQERVEQDTPEFIAALENLRDALTSGARGETTRSTQATGTRAELRDGYRSSKPRTVIIFDGDRSPSMETTISQWADDVLHNKDRGKVRAENQLFGLVTSAEKVLSRGGYGSFDTMYMFFSMAEYTKDHYDLTKTGPVAGNDRVIPGEHRSSMPNSVSKVVKPLGVRSNDLDIDGLFTILRDSQFSGENTYLAPSLQLVKDALAKDPEWAQAVRAGKEAVIMFVVTDGEIHDGRHARGDVDSANVLAKELRSAGVCIVPVVIDSSVSGMHNMTELVGGDSKYVVSCSSTTSFINGINTLADKIRQQKGGRTALDMRQSTRWQSQNRLLE